MKVLVGDKFGLWLVIGKASSAFCKGGAHARSICQCECGVIKVVYNTSLLKGSSLSCGCWGRSWVGMINSKARLKDDKVVAINHLFKGYKNGARHRNIKFDLSIDQFSNIINKNCNYCGELPSNKFNGFPTPRESPFLYSGIDRIDSNLGYTIENCVPCCRTCNVAKSTSSKQQFLAWISKVYHHGFSSATNEFEF